MNGGPTESKEEKKDINKVLHLAKVFYTFGIFLF